MLVELFVGNGLSIEHAGRQIGGGGGGSRCHCQWLSVGSGLCIRSGARCQRQRLIVGVVVQTLLRVR